MIKYEITFRDEVEHENIDECVASFLEYLQECVENGDVSAFGIYKLEEVVHD
jgi:hypothetical protein